jgi:hypothetical protein
MAFAMPAKTELAFSGSYVNPKEGPAIWQVGGDVLFPLTDGGVVILGPSVVMSDNDDQTGGGATLEFNVPGQNGGFFFGGQALYYLDSEEGQDDHTALARVGIKLPISQSGLFKFYLQQGLTGRDRDADLSGGLAAVIKF